MIPENFSIPLLFELENERKRTHMWMQIAKSRGVEDLDHIEDQLQETGRELSSVREREAIMKTQLEAKNTWLRKYL